MTTLKSTSILAQNPYHIISIQGQMPMSHAQNTYDFEIAGQEMTNTNISMTTTRKNTQSITKN